MPDRKPVFREGKLLFQCKHYGIRSSVPPCDTWGFSGTQSLYITKRVVKNWAPVSRFL